MIFTPLESPRSQIFNGAKIMENGYVHQKSRTLFVEDNFGQDYYHHPIGLVVGLWVGIKLFWHIDRDFYHASANTGNKTSIPKCRKMTATCTVELIN